MSEMSCFSSSPQASSPGRVVIVGGGWWAQTRHIPQLDACPQVHLVAVVEPNSSPTSPMDELMDMPTLFNTYKVPVFASIDDFFAAGLDYDGAVICTNHATHHTIGMKLLERKKHILIEKPMTVNVEEAEELHYHASLSDKFFQVNHSANWRPQTKKAKEIVEKGIIGEIRQVVCSMGSPLQHLFEDPNSGGWIRLPNGEFSGFGWGQLTHTIAWVFLVTGAVPETAYCLMSTSPKSGADLYNAGSIKCKNGCIISISGIATISPCYKTSVQTSDTESKVIIRKGKQIENRIYGSEGMMLYCGDDEDISSGCLSVSRNDGALMDVYDSYGFQFENTAKTKEMTESLASFVDACNGLQYWPGASSALGLLTVKTIDALYRSAKSGHPENV